MAAHLFCMTTDGGVPLFQRSQGYQKMLSYSLIGSLNGVHLFANHSSLDLQTAHSDKCKIVWKIYHNSLTLILVVDDNGAGSGSLMSHLFLDIIFYALVLQHGMDELLSIQSIERFKNNIKRSFYIMDVLLKKMLTETSFSILMTCADCITGIETVTLQNCLDGFTTAAQSEYGCLVVGDKIAVATTKWWQLPSIELILIPLFINSLFYSTAQDVAVFLPFTSPKIPHRLLVFSLFSGIKICVICGAEPELDAVERKVESFWKSAFDTTLTNLLQLSYTPNLHPFGISTDIKSILLVNKTSNRCWHSANCHYYDLTLRDLVCCDADALWKHTTEKYVIADTYKYYALNVCDYKMFLIFHSSFPTFSMRSLSHRTFDILMSVKWMTI